MPTRSKHPGGHEREESREKKHETHETRGKHHEKKMGDMPGNQTPNTPNRKESERKRER
jgi:hypothetical protein